MRKFIVIAAAAALAATAAIAAPADASARHFRNCTAMHKVYPHGIAKSRAAARAHGWEAKVSASLYKANKRMDRDRDGVACERYW
jgi:opacity protein-like surface antigen